MLVLCQTVTTYERKVYLCIAITLPKLSSVFDTTLNHLP